MKINILLATLNHIVENAVQTGTPKFGRFLATILERHAVRLRMKHGGATILESRYTRKVGGCETCGGYPGKPGNPCIFCDHGVYE